MLTAGDDGDIALRSLADGAVLHVFSAPGHGGATSSPSLARDKPAVGVHEAGTAILWDLEKRSALHVPTGHDWSAVGVAVSPDGTRAVTGDGQEVRIFNGHSGTVYAIAPSADGERLLSASLDGTARHWNLATGREIATLTGHNGPVYAVTFGPDGTLITGGNDRTIRIWGADGGRKLAIFPGAAE